jgi:hypothetical protein
MKMTRTVLLAFAVLMLSPGEIPLAQEVERFSVASGPLRYQVVAGQPRRNRRVMGAVTRYVHGVPAEPVDSMVYDGEGSMPVEGHLFLEVDPVNDTGFVQAEWTDEHGNWVYIQERFIHPEHSSGVRLGPSIFDLESFLNEGITHNVYLHGDTTAGMPVLPTVFTHLAAWGPAWVFLNGEPFENPFEIPAPQWLGHLMVTEGVRREDGTVRTHDGAIYHPSNGAVGAVETGDLELHLVFHDERFPRTDNMPNLFSFFYHLVFEDVWIQIVEAEEPLSLEFLEEPEEQQPGDETGAPAPRMRPIPSRDRTREHR